LAKNNMPQSRFYLFEVRNIGYKLTIANTPTELAFIQSQMSSHLYGMSAIVSLPIYQTGHFMYEPIVLSNSLYNNPNIISYFKNRYYYIINHSRIQRRKFTIDYSITFDTNAASYVHIIVQDSSLNNLRQEVKEAFNHILINNLNFDYIFYFIENIKIVFPIIQTISKNERNTPIKFWKLLDRNFRLNVICLRLFQKVNNTHYQSTRTLKFDTSFIQAARFSIRFVYDFYANYEKRDLINFWIQYQRIILFQILSIFKIQFSLNKSADNKFKKFLRECPVFLDKESYLALNYFRNHDKTPILHIVNMGGDQKSLWDKVNNIAWDFIAIRFFERRFLARGGADFTIPFFLGFDNELNDFIKLFSAKAVIFDTLSDNIVTVPNFDINKYFKDEGFTELVADFFSENKMNERTTNIRKNPNISRNEIKEKFKELYKVITAV
jgi:hypothetical protein